MQWTVAGPFDISEKPNLIYFLVIYDMKLYFIMSPSPPFHFLLYDWFHPISISISSSIYVFNSYFYSILDTLQTTEP